MWIFIALVVIVILFNFNKALNKDFKEVRNEGGMENKYFILVKNLTQDGLSITNRTNNSITISGKDRVLYLEFHIIKSFNDLHITWTMKNITIGTHTLNWKFNANDDQQYMIDIIDKGLKNFGDKMENSLGDKMHLL